MHEPTRLVSEQIGENGESIFTSVTTSSNMTTRALCLVSSGEVIPIVFIPGIMGSRLRIGNNKKKYAWYPPEGIWNTLCTVLTYLFKGPVERQTALDPENTIPDEEGAPCSLDKNIKISPVPKDKDTEEKKAIWRGWGQIYSKCYLSFLETLEKNCNQMFEPQTDQAQAEEARKQPSADWTTRVLEQSSAQLGAQKTFEELDAEKLYEVAHYFFPVHAVGYNWLKSNQDSAERLENEIKKIIEFYQDKAKKKCEQVILVSHSMGGLVTRLAVQRPSLAGKVLGVVHGVMPALGAPATYKRMRAGFEGAARIVLGSNAAECTAIMAYAPGPLELLPFPEYRTYPLDAEGRLREHDGEQHWLRACHKGEDGKEQTVYLGSPGEEVYERIYCPPKDGSPSEENKRIWWRLVKESLVNPRDKKKREKARREAEKKGKKAPKGDGEDSDYKTFTLAMDKARETQALLKKNESSYHDNTYAFYGADKEQPAFNEVCWRLTATEPTSIEPAITPPDLPRNSGGAIESAEIGSAIAKRPNQASVPSNYVEADAELWDDHNGKVVIQVGDRKLTFEIDEAKGTGDGTVPLYSGAAIPESDKIKQLFRHEGKAKEHHSYEHTDAYKSPLAISVTLYSIAHMVYKSLKGEA